MTDAELAMQIFGPIQSESNSVSITTGIASAASSAGSVDVTLDAAQGGSETAPLSLPTLASIQPGDSVVIALYGPQGHGKKGLVLGRVGETPLSSDLSFQRVRFYQSATNSQIHASFFYQRLTGLVVAIFQTEGQHSSGFVYLNDSNPLPADLRPNALGTSGANRLGVVCWPKTGNNNSLMAHITGQGLVGFWSEQTSTQGCGATMSYFVQPGLSYVSSVTPGTLTLQKAMAAAAILGDDQSDDTKIIKNQDAYAAAYDILTGTESER